MATRRTPTPSPGRTQVDLGLAELLGDADREHGWWLSVDGVPQSYVQLDDPSHLEFEYVRLLGDVVDLLPGGPLTALHLGGGACTLPRYVAATRPGSRQIVVELDAALVELVRSQLGTDGFKLKVGEARAVASTLAPGGSDLVVADVFRGATLPMHLTTTEWATIARGLLAPGGVYAVNVADGSALSFVRGQAATLLSVFADVVLLGDPGVLRGRRFGNLILAASDSPLPVLGLRRRAARAIGTARVVHGAELVAFASGAKVVTDATAVATPVPPPAVFLR